MNILSAQEMQEAEKTLLKVVPRQNYIFLFPQEQNFQEIASFSSSTFPIATTHAQQAVTQMVALTDNLRGLTLDQPNSPYHMLLYAVLSVLYRDKYKGTEAEGAQNPHYLLETIKCSLYSPDIDLTSIQGLDFAVETVQMKAMAARFLNLMEEQSLKMAVNRLKCAEWIFQHNPLLVHAFVLLFRFILTKLQIDGAGNYQTQGQIEQSVINLIQFFDLSYRNFGQLFLFYQQGVFLALTESDIVVGDYFQNQSEKKTQKQQLQIKSSVKLNMIQSFLLSVDEKSSLVESKKKAGIVDSDVKLMNFMLDNSSDDEVEKKGVVNKEKNDDIETPHFNQCSQDLFHFGRKRKESQVKDKNDITYEFKRLILDHSDSDNDGAGHQFVVQHDQAPTPFLGGQPNFNMAPKLNTPKGEASLQAVASVDSPDDELNSVGGQNVDSLDGYNMVQQSNLKKSAQNSQWHKQGPFVTQSAKVDLNVPAFFDGSNDNNFYRVKSRETVGMADDLYEMVNCGCRKIKGRRIGLSSNINEHTINPNLNYLKSNAISRDASPKVSTSNSVKNLRNYTGDYCTTKMDNKKSPANKNEHKPAFLKNLMKNKDKNYGQKKAAKSTIGQHHNKTIQFPLNRPKMEYKQLPQKTSAIISHEMNKFEGFGQGDYDSKETGKRSMREGQYRSGNMHFYKNSKNLQKQNQQEPGSAWQTTSNFHQRVPNYMPMHKGKPNLTSNPTSNPNTTSKRSEPYKFYAPVQIVAPTVYFNSPKNDTSNNTVLKVNQFRDKQHNPESKGVELPKGGHAQSNTPLEYMKPHQLKHSYSAINNFGKDL